ncbi:MAG TPA: mechanosensitive ion channel [Anaerolineales bacterium]|nr:mechanosensitive ion channel [Anaerolineales bacterium]
MTDQFTSVSDALNQLLLNFVNFIPLLIVALIVFVVGLYLAGIFGRTVRRGLERRKTDPELILLASKITRWTVIVLGTLAALQQVSFNVTAFLTGLGIVGFTIGFALQDVSKNFVAGLLILIQQPFDIGDAIKVTDYAGTVIAIDLRATEIHTFDGQVVYIPNGDVFTNPITNYTKASKRRVDLSAGVAYESDLEEVTQTALEAISSIPGMLQDPAPTLHFQGFGGTTIDLTLFYWIDTNQTDPLTAKDIGLKSLKVAFERSGIEMPYPTQRVYLEQQA